MRRLSSLIALVSLVAASCSAEEEYDLPRRPLPTDPEEAVATFYDADGSGNCSFDRSADADVVALAMPEYDRSAACGACLRVTGPNGEVTVRVVDSCPPCARSRVTLDLSAQAFAKIADPRDGRVAVRYRRVPCAVTGALAFRFKEGSSSYWTAIQVRNHRVPIAAVEYRRSGRWVPMRRETYNYFVESRGVGDQPDGLALRVTAIDGQVIEETLPGSVAAGRTLAGTQQFRP